MAITFQSRTEDGLLVVTAAGRDDNLQEVIDYGRAVMDLAAQAGQTHVLCDERNLVYTLDTVDTFHLAKNIAEHAPSVTRLAIVCRPQDFEDGKFWETVAVNRGLHARVFTDVLKARAWLANVE